MIKKKNLLESLFNSFIFKIVQDYRKNLYSPLDLDINYKTEWYSSTTKEKDFILIRKDFLNQIKNINGFDLSKDFSMFIESNNIESDEISSDIYVMY